MRRKKVVYLEDDERMARLVSDTLEQHGFQVISISGWEGSLDKAEALEPDVVLVGLQSLGDDYSKVLLQADRSERLKRIPKVAVTDKKQCYDLVGPRISNPLWDYIAYPWESLELVTVVTSLLEKAETWNRL